MEQLQGELELRSDSIDDSGIRVQKKNDNTLWFVRQEAEQPLAILRWEHNGGCIVIYAGEDSVSREVEGEFWVGPEDPV